MLDLNVWGRGRFNSRGSRLKGSCAREWDPAIIKIAEIKPKLSGCWCPITQKIKNTKLTTQFRHSVDLLGTSKETRTSIVFHQVKTKLLIRLEWFRKRCFIGILRHDLEKVCPINLTFNSILESYPIIWLDVIAINTYHRSFGKDLFFDIDHLVIACNVTVENFSETEIVNLSHGVCLVDGLFVK